MPIFLYVTNQVSKCFESVDFELAKSEDERIAVDELAKTVEGGATRSIASTNLISNMNAIKLLRKKILFLIDVFTQAPEVKNNSNFCRRL